MSEVRRLRDRALDHPLRREMSAMLCEEELTTAEMTDRLGGPTFANVAYHLRVLERVELVERVGGVYRRA